MIRRRHALYVASAALHVLIGTAVAAVRTPPVRETVSITVREVRRPRTPPRETPPPPPPPAPPTPAAAPAPAPRRNQAPRPSAPTPAPSRASSAPSSAPAPDFGVALGGETGGGMAVPGGGGGGSAPAAQEASAPAREAHRASHEDECSEAAVRPRVLEMPEPEYPEAARDENIEGRVRVELSLDEQGHVVRARVIDGLGHGLDEAALTAARGARFEPATRCGRAVSTTFTVSVRFTL